VPLLATVRSPKSPAVPVVAIVTFSAAFVFGCPPENTPRVESEQHPVISPLAITASPKSFAFPVDAIVIKSIVLSNPGEADPEWNNPRVLLAPPPPPPLATFRSPKSVASPVVSIVTY